MTTYLEEINMNQLEIEDDSIEINDSIEYEFIHELELAIDNGDTRIIDNVIKKYKNTINISYINWGEKIKLEILEDMIDDMKI